MKGLKNCPFCNGDNLDPPGDGAHYVMCLDCGAYGPEFNPEADEPIPMEQIIAGAFARWNVRDGRLAYAPPARVLWWSVENPDKVFADEYDELTGLGLGE